MKEEYLAEQIESQEKIRERAKAMCKEHDCPDDNHMVWRKSLDAALDLGLIRHTWSMQTRTHEIERQKPWTKLVLREQIYAHTPGRTSKTYLLLEASPEYLIEEINKDRLIEEALLKIVDEGRLDGSIRHFGGQKTRLEVGKVFTVDVWTD